MSYAEKLLIHNIFTAIQHGKTRSFAKHAGYSQDAQALVLALLDFYDPF